MLLIRSLMRLYETQRESRSVGTRVMRESSTLRVTEGVWAEVASARELGFRSNDGAPLLYGDLPSQAALEMAIYETNQGEYRTVATARFPEPRAGRLSVVPARGLARVGRALRPFPAASPDFGARFFVRSKPGTLTALLVPEVQAMLVDLGDREPSLYWSDETATLVLEGVEMVHERLEAVIDGLNAMAGGVGRLGAPPYRA